MYRRIIIVVAAFNAATGFGMFVAPVFFYETVPGVEMLGPFNLHFIRDAGLSYGASGLLLALGWQRHEYSWSRAGSLWPLFHALCHLQRWVAREMPVDLVAVVNLVGIQLPAWAALFAAFMLYRASPRHGREV